MKGVNRISAFFFNSYLEDGETIAVILHKHIITLLQPLIVNSVIFFILPATIWIVAPKLALPAFIIILIGTWRLFYKTIAWYFNTLLVTNLNLVDITWNGFFERSATRVEYNQIESFSYAISGFLSTILNMGDVIIAKNSGTEVPIPHLYRPKKKTQILTQLQDQFMTNHQQRQSGAIKDLLTSMLEQHILENGIVIDDE